MVRTFGSASGRDMWSAQHAAASAAHLSGIRAVNAAGCPCCGRLSPAMLMQFEDAARRARTKKKIALPIATGIALVLSILLAIPAIGDIRHSLALVVVAGSVPTAVGAFLYAILASKVVTPPTNPFGVWFSRDPHGSPGTWFSRALLTTQPKPTSNRIRPTKTTRRHPHLT
jgi:hypothetical protein